MSASTLARFINPKTGPIISIVSTPYPGFFSRRFWQSAARLHPDCGACGMKTKIFVPCGGGWSRDKEVSQCKAVSEAIERWAFRYYCRGEKGNAGLDIDPTSNGFAALPAFLGEDRLITGAFCEAVERWALGRMWDHGDIGLMETESLESPATELFECSKGKLHCFMTKFLAAKPGQVCREEVTFCLCIFETSEGGAIPGSACGTDRSSVFERAAAEAFVNLSAFNSMRKKKIGVFEDILEKRLHFFGSRPDGYKEVSGKLNRSGGTASCEVPEVIFSKRLSGPWEPEVLVHRVLVDNARLVTFGGADRFVL